MPNQIILVTGATGHQGGAVARHLLQCGFAVHALMRDRDKPAARVLADKGAFLLEATSTTAPRLTLRYAAWTVCFRCRAWKADSKSKS